MLVHGKELYTLNIFPGWFFKYLFLVQSFLCFWIFVWTEEERSEVTTINGRRVQDHWVFLIVPSVGSDSHHRVDTYWKDIFNMYKHKGFTTTEAKAAYQWVITLCRKELHEWNHIVQELFFHFVKKNIIHEWNHIVWELFMMQQPLKKF